MQCNTHHRPPPASAPIDNSNRNSLWAYNWDTPSSMVSQELFPSCVNLLRGDCLEGHLQGTMLITKMAECGLSIWELLDRACFDLLSAQMRRDDSPSLQYYSAWALNQVFVSNIAQIDAFVRPTDVQNLQHLLRSPDAHCREQAAWGLVYILQSSGQSLPPVPWQSFMTEIVASDEKRGTPFRLTSSVLAGLCARGTELQPGDEDCTFAATLLLKMLRHRIVPREITMTAEGVLICLSTNPVASQRIVRSRWWTLQLDLIKGIGRGYANNGLTRADAVPGALQIAANVAAFPCNLRALLDGGVLSAMRDHIAGNDIDIVAKFIANMARGNSNQIKALIDANLISLLVDQAPHHGIYFGQWAAVIVADATIGASKQQRCYFVYSGLVRYLRAALPRFGALTFSLSDPIPATSVLDDLFDVVISAKIIHAIEVCVVSGQLSPHAFWETLHFGDGGDGDGRTPHESESFRHTMATNATTALDVVVV